MDNRRVLLAIVLTFGVLTLWSLFVAPPRPDVVGPPESSAVPLGTPGALPSVAAQAGPEAAEAPRGESAVTDTEVRQIRIRSDLYDVTLTNRGARIQRWALEKYRANVPRPGEQAGPVELVSEGSAYFPLAILTGESSSEEALSSALFVAEGGDAFLGRDEEANVTFRWSDGKGSIVEKRLRFQGGSYVVGVDVKAELAGGHKAYLALTPGLIDRPDPARSGGYSGRAVLLVEGKAERIDASSFSRKKLEAAAGGWPPPGGRWLKPVEAAGLVTRQPGAGWAAVDDNYFAAVFFAGRPLKEVLVCPAPDPPSETGAIRLAVAVPIDESPTRLSLYAGPKDTEILKTVDPDLVRVVDFGFFEALARWLLAALRFFYRYVHNYGVAIILLTVVVKLLFLPLSIKQLHAMQKMAKLRPQMKEIEARFDGRGKATDPAEKLERNRKKNAEMMALYQREGINPASGCLPLLVQLPVLYGLLALLGASIELRHAPFVLWIQDLSAKDPLYVTPGLMLISMIVMQAITPTAADPMQRRMMFIMPVLFAWIFKDLASGLGLYWLTQNVLSIVQQVWMNRWTQQREQREKEAKRMTRGKRAKVDGLEAK